LPGKIVDIYDGLERPVLVTDATGLARLTVYDDLPDGTV
jgi:hypothetical protein